MTTDFPGLQDNINACNNILREVVIGEDHPSQNFDIKYQEQSMEKPGTLIENMLETDPGDSQDNSQSSTQEENNEKKTTGEETITDTTDENKER